MNLDHLNWSLDVVAVCDIPDNPLSREDSSARQGDRGHVEDLADGLVWVDFGRGAIPCEPGEIRQ